MLVTLRDNHLNKGGLIMKNLFLFLSLLLFFAAIVTTGVQAADKIVIGHPACLSGKYAKAGEQAVGGIKACSKWVNDTYGGVTVMISRASSG